MSTALSYIPLLGSGAILGLGVGFVAKRLGKILLIVGGVYFVSLIALHYRGLITINTSLDATVGGFASFLTQRIGTGWAAAAVSLPVLGAFAAGLYFGVRRF
jgi:uncharacterized membrane protein (Fun14 family)